MERDGQVLVLLDGGFEPLFTMSGKLVVGQKRYGEGDVGLGRAEVAILEGLVNGMECSAASRLLQVGEWRRPPGLYAGRCAVVWLLQRMLECVW